MMTLDGTVIDDEEYFQLLPAQTLFIFRLNGETFETGIHLQLITFHHKLIL